MMGSCFPKTQEESQETTTSTDITEKYKFGRLVGKGATCRVMKAFDNENKENIAAIKIMPKEQSHFQTLFSNEIKILSHLQKYNSKQNITQLISYDQDKHNYYIVMNFYEGGELLDRIIGLENKLTEKISQSIIKQLLTIIDGLHQQNIVHRDIRP
eukprot:416789_1